MTNIMTSWISLFWGWNASVKEVLGQGESFGLFLWIEVLLKLFEAERENKDVMEVQLLLFSFLTVLGWNASQRGARSGGELCPLACSFKCIQVAKKAFWRKKGCDGNAELLFLNKVYSLVPPPTLWGKMRQWKNRAWSRASCFRFILVKRMQLKCSFILIIMCTGGLF